MSEFTTLMAGIESKLAFMKSMSETPVFTEKAAVKTLRKVKKLLD